jgi:copper chaperone
MALFMVGMQASGEKSRLVPNPCREPAMIELTLPAMTYGHCVRTVIEAAQRVDDQTTVVIDLPNHQLQIESAQPAQAFVAALAEVGYATA